MPISFLSIRNDLLMLNKIYNCDTALRFDDYWKAFMGPRINRFAARRGQNLIGRNQSKWKCILF